MKLRWRKCKGNVWCLLTRLDLGKVHEHGVYIIWHEGNPPRAVYVGQGDVADRLKEHCHNKKIMRDAQKGELRVTWASVPDHLCDGVELYLANEYDPLVGKRYPDVDPIVVNKPW